MRTTKVACFASALLTCIMSIFAFAPHAHADELSDAKAELAAQVEKLDELSAKVSELQSQIDEKAASAEQLQVDINNKRDAIGSMTVFFYKNPTASLIEYMLASDDISQMIARAEFLYDYTDDLAKQATEEREMQKALQSEISDISAQKDEQEAALDEMKSSVAELEAKKDQLEEEQRAKLAAGSSFVTDFASGEWREGKASAYGGDDGAGSTTAMGTSIHNTPAVAVPMSWPNYRSYFGKKVEISYNGKSVIGVISDCGGFGKYGRDLDISYTVIRAWGFNSTSAWGVRTVKWRIL